MMQSNDRKRAADNKVCDSCQTESKKYRTNTVTDERNNANIVGEVIKSKQYVIIYTNADSLFNKRLHLINKLKEFSPDIVAVTEVLPKKFNRKNLLGDEEMSRDDKDNVWQRELRKEDTDDLLQDYQIFHNLDEKKVRGIAVYAKKKLNPLIKKFNSGFKEAIFIEINKLLFGAIYRSPNGSKENNENLNKLLVEVTDSQPANIIVVGDFNYKEIIWKNGLGICSGNKVMTEFVKTLKDASLMQHVTNPTRFRDGQKPALDDLVLSDSQAVVILPTTDYESLPRLGRSDHVVLNINVAVPLSRTLQSVTLTLDNVVDEVKDEDEGCTRTVKKSSSIETKEEIDPVDGANNGDFDMSRMAKLLRDGGVGGCA